MSSSPEVEAIQKALNEVNIPVTVDGIFGGGTEAAVKLFQENYQATNSTHPNYTIDSKNGVVDQYTLLGLDEALIDGWKYVKKDTVLKSDLLKQSEPLNLVASKGETIYQKGNTNKADVKLIQQALLKMDFEIGQQKDDGDFGDKTVSAIKLFQIHYKVTNATHPEYKIGKADGIVGKNTLLGLDEALMDGWKYKPHNWADSVLGNIIGKVESNNDYSAYNSFINGRLIPKYKTSLSDLTLSEVMKKQKDREVFAAGRFQIITGTLEDATQALSLDGSLLFDKLLQDRLFNEYLISKKRPMVITYLKGGGKIEDAMYSLAQEFASIGVEKGKPLYNKKIAIGGESYYQGDGYNKAHITPDDIGNALIEAKKRGY